ncbi:hypothetical protein ACOSQ2_010410 [Xanthoceras sorbifolium]
MIERKFASDSMSNLSPRVLSADDALARRRERAKASAQKCKQSSGQKNVAEMLKTGQPSTLAPTSGSPPSSSAEKDVFK